ncbi:MAG TPA: type II toxin-antitoxin system RelE/ParE family toxin [Candidatus Riflebacteria bacterium]|jgi:phage-related protein|nr:type II toxin-antitoxin system RelE/ParE family toxin [Candidatus Riflebacteria bacterium]
MQKFEVIFYETADGKKPVKEFLDKLSVKMKAKTIRTIVMLQNNGPALREPCSKPLGDGIFELRAKVATNITRVLYFFFIGRKVVLTNGFIKKTQETPVTEIELAKRYRAEYLGRKGNKRD